MMANVSLDLNRPIMFQTQDESPLELQAIQVISHTEESVSDVRLLLQTDFLSYEAIVDRGDFNLATKWRGAMTGEFVPEEPIVLELTLLPERIPQPVPDDLTEILNKHNLQTELWFCLGVYQQLETTQVGYRTFWDKTNLGQLNRAVNIGVEAITQLFSALQEEVEEILAPGEQESQWASILQQLERWSEEEEEETMTEVVREFFDREDWPFIQLEEGLFQLAFAGENGRWRCYTRIRQAEEQLLFYSICPLVVSDDRRTAIAEFLTNVNYGAVIGNFELDWSDGEIRYKTSIDVEGDRLSVPLMENLVYANVIMMDRYLPGIVAVIEDETSVDEAIARIEKSPSA
ncbi:YbjN domain-containing protein [Roseofilum casamattae]|uniref:YbjN domain-containing protein n=1 Tax=Roseofilum casamattae BLCC-M143 TaxID=3022442 RepID=A0ABT7BW81_9CYAN|nr:YbjN domain-containing protein [Roseofilum casamattae]MDJ1183067.1 YbjN domain-containing protein [Roseofilum casamattae BLCC-M143]